MLPPAKKKKSGRKFYLSPTVTVEALPQMLQETCSLTASLLLCLLMEELEGARVLKLLQVSKLTACGSVN